MQIVFSARPAYGHVYPLVPLANAARRAGHDVRFATTGGFLDKLRRWGFPTDDVGISLEDAQLQLLASMSLDKMPRSRHGRPDVEVGGRLFLDLLAPRTAADLAPLLSYLEPDLVVYEQYDIGAAVAAHHVGIPAVCHALSPRLPDDVLQVLTGDRLARLWAGYGGTPASFDVFTGDVYLDIFPTALQQPSFLDHPARVPLRPVPFAEPDASVPGWIASRERPLVYLTLGTVVASDEVLRPVITGLGRVEADVLLALGSAGGTELGNLPPNVHVEPFVHQPAILRRAELAVHHGGSGTILSSLICGTPQVILPKGTDQFWNADVMARSGLAEVLEPAHITPDAVAQAAITALAEPRPAVEAVRREIDAMPSPAAVVEILEDLEELPAA